MENFPVVYTQYVKHFGGGFIIIFLNNRNLCSGISHCFWVGLIKKYFLDLCQENLF